MLLRGWRKWINRVERRRESSATHSAPHPVEPLEQRLLLAAATPPHVIMTEADNRGYVLVKFDRPLAARTVTTGSVQLLNGTQKVRASVSYSAAQRQIRISANKLPADSTYTIKLVSSLLKGTNGKSLDGEFNGAGMPSGNGKPGGDYVAVATPAAEKIARFTTTLGTIDVKLFSEETPLTVQNFLRYANEGKWDGTFFHRSEPDYLVQGGAYYVNNRGQYGAVSTKAPIQNEAQPGEPGNIRGTIAMATIPGQPDSATNQWYFNTANNQQFLDTWNGGTTVFGQIVEGLAVLDKIANKETYNAFPDKPNSAFSQMPLTNSRKVPKYGLPRTQSLIVVTRLAILADLTAPGTTPTGTPTAIGTPAASETPTAV